MKGTSIVGSGTISQALTAVRTNAGGRACLIRFGTITTLTVDSSAGFNNSGGTWGPVTISGIITSAVASPGATVAINDGVTVISSADISNTGTGRAINHSSTGSLAVVSGTVSASTSSGVAIYSTGAGLITVSQAPGVATLITSANTAAANGTIVLEAASPDTANVRLLITGGTVRNTAAGTTGNAVYNGSLGTGSISGGAVSTTATTGYAVRSTGGIITITSGATITPTGNTFGTVIGP